MWPYTQDEMTWLALPQERRAAASARRAIDRAWLRRVGVPDPANDEPAARISMIDPRR
ncbi:MAG TPA: hypothetical protein VFZ03_01855 [Dongiaceae bacterium]